MSAWQPQLDEVVEVFTFYDEPVLFVCRNILGSPFLTVLSDIQHESKTWICVPMSEARRAAVRRGDVDLYAAFRDSETHTVFRVTRRTKGNGAAESYEELAASQVDNDALPLRGERVRITNDSFTNIESVAHVARAERTDVMRLRLSTYEGRQSIPSLLLGSLLIDTQRSLDAIGEGLARSRRQRRKKGKANPNELRVVGTFAGSFGIDFRAAEAPDMFDESPITPALEHFFRILHASHHRSAAQLEEMAKLLKRKPIYHMRTFLQDVRGGVKQVDATWARPNHDEPRREVMTAGDAEFCLSVFSQNASEEAHRFTITARLVGVNVRSKTYEIVDVDEGRPYVGRAADAVIGQAARFTTNEVYLATIEEIVSATPTGETETKFNLLGLEQVDPERN
jgi:hypothetical protein